MLMTRHEGIKVTVERVGLMILLTPVDEALPRWRITKQFGVEEIPGREKNKEVV